MRKLNLLLIPLMALLLAQCTKMPQEIDHPDRGLSNTSMIEISKIIRTDTSTVLYVDAFAYPGNWITIDPATYLQAEGQKFTILSSEGIELDDKFFMPESGEHSFILTFPALPKDAKSFDFIEGEPENYFKIWDIDLTGKPKAYQSEIPKELLNVKIDKSVSLTQPKFEMGKTKVTLHLSGLREKYVADDLKLYTSAIMGGDVVGAEGVGENKYIFEFEQYVSASFYIPLSNTAISFFLNPGENAEIYLDMTARARYNARYNPQKDLKYIVFKGDFEQVNNQLGYFDSYGIEMDIMKYQDTTIVDMPKEQFLDKAFDIYHSKLAEVEQSELSPLLKLSAKNELKSNLVQVLNAMPQMYMVSYRTKNKIDWGEQINYTPPTASQDDFLRLKDIHLNDSLWVYSSSFGYTGVNLALRVSDETLNQITGTETGLLQDLKKSKRLMVKASKIERLTPEEEKILASTSSPYYTEAYNAIYNNVKRQYEAAIAKGGFVIEETPQVADDKVLDAILAKHKGQPVFVDLWATWCGPCLSAMKTIKSIKPEMGEKGVISIYLSAPSSNKAQWSTMLSNIGGIHYFMNEGQWDALVKKYEFDGIPTYLIFDKTGKKAFQCSGYPGNDAIKEELAKVW